MKKIGIIIGIICVIVAGIGTLWFMDKLQNKIETTETEKTLLKQKAQVLEEKLTAIQNKLKKEAFVNPLFYKRLEALGTLDSDAYLTPKSRATLNFTSRAGDKQYEGGWNYAGCDLLENEPDYIVMYCQFLGSVGKKGLAEFYRFTISPCTPEDDFLKCQYRVVETSSSWKENLGKSNISNYVIR